MPLLTPGLAALLTADPTGLGNSAGGNTLTGYTGTGRKLRRFRDDNLAAQSDVYARNNNFGAVVTNSVIEGKIYDDTDDPTLSKVLFEPPTISPPPTPSSTVYVNDDWGRRRHRH